jgi:hypothetical protein
MMAEHRAVKTAPCQHHRLKNKPSYRAYAGRREDVK